MTIELSEKLDQLANFQAQRDVLELQKKELMDQILPPEVKARLEEIEIEFAQRKEAVEANITTLEAEIKDDVLRYGQTVKGTFLRVVYHAGRVSWDNKALDAYARAQPEVLKFRRQGEPYVSITKVNL
jgi:hypothetical protein